MDIPIVTSVQNTNIDNFYDGKLFFDREKKSVWPLVMSILNCDSNLRTHLGVGLCLIKLHIVAIDYPLFRIVKEQTNSTESPHRLL